MVLSKPILSTEVVAPSLRVLLWLLVGLLLAGLAESGRGPASYWLAAWSALLAGVSLATANLGFDKRRAAWLRIPARRATPAQLAIAI